MPDLSDDFPVLLGPVRIETRFTNTHLLIRVFPDEWSVDKFEPKPTLAEVETLDAYWTALWRAGGNPVAEQSAWQELTARMPPGRATWLLQTRKPANPADKPASVPPGTTVLVVVAGQAVPAEDRQPTITYWTAVWQAHGDRVKLRNADIALVTAVGATRATAIRSRPPAGIDAAPTSPGDAVAVAFLVLPPPAPADIALQSWTRAAKARLLPDKFTVLGFKNGQQVLTATGAALPDTLAVSPDPGTTTNQLQVNEQTGALRVPDDLRWLTDFDRAVQLGTGLKIPLTVQISDGLDRLVVYGLRQKTGPEQTGTDLADLITRQLRSPAGFSLLPQGTPTNNTEQRPAGQDAQEEAEASLQTAPGFTTTAAGPEPWTTKTDGEWFAELLGIDPAVLTGAPNADRTDQRDARAANVALWPATWGNFLQTVLQPILSDEMVAETRRFFTRYVSGRGPVPAVKIGRQPYGILPTTAFSRLTWPAAAAHRRGLHKVLGEAAEDWQHAARTKVSHLGTTQDAEADDPHQKLLDILALHPTSAEWYQRYAQSVEDLYNRENLAGLGPTVLPAVYDSLDMEAPIQALLARFGFQADPQRANRDPDLVRRLFVGTQHPVLAPLVDDRPLSETDPIRDYFPGPQGSRTYLHWLAKYAHDDLDTIRLEKGFAGRPPSTLLYFLLRHAVLLDATETARLLAIAKGSAFVPSTADPLFVHVAHADPPESLRSESRFRQLYAPDQAITGHPDRLVVDYLPDVIDTHTAAAGLREQIEAIKLLADLPTARLERVLVEHLDCATYRLDAWQLGLANERLSELRFGPDGTTPARRGVHLGAYGWLEDVAPRPKPLTQVALTGPLAQVFDTTSIPHDPDNGGYIHAPSPAHARTAAVLRAGYLANAGEDDPDTFAVNLSSERVRVALTMLDGLRQGQSLGALLGHRFERALHDNYPNPELPDVELDRFIPFLRGAFPLRAGRLPGSDPEPGMPVELIEARNVVDGLALVRRATREPASPTYPFGADGLPDDATEHEQQAMYREVQRLLEIQDALADLAVAEGTHQALLGNAERASATLDAYAKEGFPPEPAVVETPRSGVTLTHRLGLELRPGLSPILGDSPRAKAEPAVNDWLPNLLPSRMDLAALVTWTDPVNGQSRSRVVTQFDIDLEPIDLLWAVQQAGEAAMTDLDDQIVGYVVDRDTPRPDAVLTIRYTQRVDGKVTFFELSPLIDALRSLLTTARPLRPTDLVPAASGATVDRAADSAISLPRQRPAAVREALDDLREDVADFLEDLSPLYPAEPAPPLRDQLINGIDGFLTRYAELIVTAGGYGMVRSGWGEVTAWRRSVYANMLAAVAETAERMSRALTEANGLIAQYDTQPSLPIETKFRLLQQAERLLTTKPTSPRPDTPQKLREIVGSRRNSFDHRLNDLADIDHTNEKTLSGLLDEVSNLLPLTAFDPIGLDLTPFEDRILVYGKDLLDRTQALQTEITNRLTAADQALDDYDKAVTGPDRVEAALDALKAMLGEDVLAVPEFTPPSQLATDWRKARNDSDDLIKHLTQDFNRDFPVDDWLHGIARVREKPRLWEKAVLLSDALRGSGGLLSLQEPELEPVQLPYRDDDHWLGLEFPAGATINEDKLLFTAHYAVQPSLGNDPHCGLLFDEWTEVIPAARETTGIAVNIDRPDSEPPQAMLLVTPPAKTGIWKLDDLIAAVNETFDLAKTRAVEPEHLGDTAYAQLLPATVMSATRRPITISTDLTIANLRWKAAP